MKRLDVAPLTWKKYSIKNDSPRQGHSATLVGSKVYVFGGYNSRTGKDINDILVVEPLKRGYRVRPLQGVEGWIPGPRRNHSAHLIEDKLFVFGGWVGTGSKQTCDQNVYIFDLVLMECSKPATEGGTHPLLGGHISEYVLGWNVVVCFGGGVKGIYENSVTLFRLKYMTWEKTKTKGKCPTPRSRAASCFIGITCYIYGGRNGEEQYGDIHLLRFPVDRSMPVWSSPLLDNVPETRAGAALACLHGNVVLFGGRWDHRLGEDLHVFDVKLQHWRKAIRTRDPQVASDTRVDVGGPWPSFREDHTLTKLAGDSLLLFAGGTYTRGGIGIVGRFYTLQRVTS